eukprot:COSAG02_NODE_1039_length_15040_cov_70.746737_7_plen_64_part_00
MAGGTADHSPQSIESYSGIDDSVSVYKYLATFRKAMRDCNDGIRHLPRAAGRKPTGGPIHSGA